MQCVAVMIEERGAAQMDAGTIIIIVDAYVHSREGLGASLRGAGFTVETAASAWQAITKMKERRLALAIIDLDLPSTDGGAVGGWDLVRIFRAFHAAAPVILIGTDRWRPPAEESAAGVEFLEKPIDPRAVRTMVAALCRDVAREGRTCPATGVPGA
jgi:DNA-binding response OmpR family regulator